MQQINLHQRKLYAMAEAALALIGMLLTWTNEKNFLTGQTSSQNGFNSWGYLALIGIIGVIVATLLMGDKTKEYDKNTKNIVMGAFALIAAGAIIYFFALGAAEKSAINDQQRQLQQLGYQLQNGAQSYTANAGPGLWMTFGAGLIGLAWVAGVLDKLATPKTQAPAAATTAAAPAAPPAPQPPPTA